MPLANSGGDVCLWHKADMAMRSVMSAFGGKAMGRSPSRREKGNAAFTASISLYRSTWRGCARRQSGWRSDGPPLHQPCPCGEWFVVPDAAVVTEPNRF